MLWALGVPMLSMTCAHCTHFDASRGWCDARQFDSQARLPNREYFAARPAQGE
jgi:hypothetical protein